MKMINMKIKCASCGKEEELMGIAHGKDYCFECWTNDLEKEDKNVS